MIPVEPLRASDASAFAEGRPPPVTELSDGVFAIAVPMENPRLHYSLCYAIEGAGRELHLIDSGIDSNDNWAALRWGIEAVGHTVTDVATVTITHLHLDHAGLADRIRRASGARIRMHELDARAMRSRATYIEEERIEPLLGEWGVPSYARGELREAAMLLVAAGPSVDVDEMLGETSELTAGDRVLRAWHTPGHTRGHVVVADDAAGLIFTGDHLLPVTSTGLGLGGWEPGFDPVGDYLATLGPIAELDDHIACPGHGYAFRGVAARCDHARRHLEGRAEEIAAVRAAHPRIPVWEIARRVRWTAGWDRLRRIHLLSALTQTAFHVGRSNPGSS